MRQETNAIVIQGRMSLIRVGKFPRQARTCSRSFEELRLLVSRTRRMYAYIFASSNDGVPVRHWFGRSIGGVDCGRTAPLTCDLGNVRKTVPIMQKDIRVAIAGVGNCASALVQGVEYYRNRNGAQPE